MSKSALICGVTGQDGAYLAKFLIRKGYKIYGTTRQRLDNVVSNLQSVGVAESVTLFRSSLSSPDEVLKIISASKPDQIYNLAGQSSIGTSFSVPIETFKSIEHSTVNLLEAIRHSKLPIKFYNASSGEIFGGSYGMASREDSEICPKSPYAIAKSSSSFLVKLYREAYGMFACNGIMFNHESPLRGNRFVTQKVVNFVNSIAHGKKSQKLYLGDLSIERDWGWAPDFVEAMWLMLEHSEPVDFVISTGVVQSLENFVDHAFTLRGLDWKDYVFEDQKLFRPSEPKRTFGNPYLAKTILGWQPKTIGCDVVRKLLENELY